MKKARYLFLGILFLSKITAAQEMWGIANSNYAGNMGMHLNPASMVGAPYKYEINLVAADFFFDNNYLNWNNFPAMISSDGVVHDYNTPSTKHAYLSGLVIGPSAILNKGNEAFAIRTELRALTSANNVPYHLAKTLYSDFHYAPQHGIIFQDTKMNAAMLMFADIGLSYGRVLRDNDENWVSWGATLHGIIAFDGIYLRTAIDNYVVPDSNTWVVQNLDMDYGYSSTGSTNSSGGDILGIRGFGGSLDGGLILYHKRQPSAYKCDRDADMIKKYDYRLGVSLLDVGYVSFFSGSSYHLAGSGTWNGADSAIKVSSLGVFDQRFNGQFNGSKTGSKIGMYTPAAASVQFDYCFKPRWYANLSVIQRIPFSYKEVWRENSVALVPRYETRRFEASLSANLYEYEHLDAGVALRWWVFVVGTDRLLTFFTSPVRSFDLFFGIRYNSCTMNSKKKKTGQCPFD